MKRIGFNWYIYDISVDYDAIAFDDPLDIHKSLMKKNDSMIKCLGLLKSVLLQDQHFYRL